MSVLVVAQSSSEIPEGLMNNPVYSVRIHEETSEVVHLAHKFIWCWNLDTSEGRSEIPGKFLNLVIEMDENDQLDRSCEK